MKQSGHDQHLSIVFVHYMLERCCGIHGQHTMDPDISLRMPLRVLADSPQGFQLRKHGDDTRVHQKLQPNGGLRRLQE
tara:strand:- start:185 stop:418 length:234 start_codon:yes stop_codon:yes gene_type:complete